MPLAATNTAAGASDHFELAEVFRRYGDSYRRKHRMPLSQLKVMSAIESCRTAQLGGHREYCAQCGFERFAYNSCRNRHCPKCQTLAKAQWLEDREAELLPVPYYAQTEVMASVTVKLAKGVQLKQTNCT